MQQVRNVFRQWQTKCWHRCSTQICWPKDKRQEPQRRRYVRCPRRSTTHSHTHIQSHILTHTHIVTLDRRRTWVLIRQHLPRPTTLSDTHREREPQVREIARVWAREVKRARDWERAQLCAYLSCHNNCLNAWVDRIRRKRRSRSSYDFWYTHRQTRSHTKQTEPSRTEPSWVESYLCVAQQCAFATNWQSRCKIMNKGNKVKRVLGLTVVDKVQQGTYCNCQKGLRCMQLHQLPVDRDFMECV